MAGLDIDFPMPNVVVPGGRFAQSYNALSNALADASLNQTKAKFAPLSTLADAESKMTYSRLMGPQFVSKLMANKDILANLKNPEEATNMLYQAGTGQTAYDNALNNIIQQQSHGSVASQFINKLKDKIFGNKNNAISQQQTQYEQPINYVNSPQEVINPGDAYTIPMQQPSQQTEINPRQRFFEKSGEAAGLEKEGEVLGDIRAKAIDEMDQEYEQAIKADVPIKNLMDISQDERFINLRNKFPFFQDTQLNALSKIGNPEEQKLIGNFTTSAKKAVAETLMGFRGRILDKEVSLSNQMKISDNDTWNVMLGKLESIATFNEMSKQRSRLASDLMKNKHITRGEALEQADKKINGKEIRNRVESQLNSYSKMVTLRNPNTGEIITIPLSQAKKGGFRSD
jgi:hypothetical protein